MYPDYITVEICDEVIKQIDANGVEMIWKC